MKNRLIVWKQYRSVYHVLAYLRFVHVRYDIRLRNTKADMSLCESCALYFVLWCVVVQ